MCADKRDFGQAESADKELKVVRKCGPRMFKKVLGSYRFSCGIKRSSICVV